MKKLYNGGKGAKRVHPSPLPPPPSSSSITYLSALPTALMAMASTLSPQEQQVLAYLLDYSQKHSKEEKAPRIKRQRNHPPEPGCSCFGCYKSFWALWDSSPNRHVIHLIIDAFEETLESKELVKGNRGKGRKWKGGFVKKMDDEAVVEEIVKANAEKLDDGHHDDDDGGDDDIEEEQGKSSVRRFMSWVFGN